MSIVKETPKIRFRETLAKGKKVNTPLTAIPGVTYIEFSRIDNTHFVNGRNQQEIIDTVTDGFAQTFATSGMTNPLKITASKEIDPITGKPKAILRSGGRRFFAVARNIAENWFGIENPAMVDADGQTVWVPVQLTTHVNFDNRADDLFYQINDNLHEAWGVASMIAVCVELVDEIQEYNGVKITAQFVADRINKKRETVQQYLRIGRQTEVLEALQEGNLPETVSVLDTMAAMVAEGEKMENIMQVVMDIEGDGYKVTSKRFDQYMTGNLDAQNNEQSKVRHATSEETQQVATKKDTTSQVATKKGSNAPAEPRYSFRQTLDSVLGRQNQISNPDVIEALEIVKRMVAESIDADDAIELLSEI